MRDPSTLRLSSTLFLALVVSTWCLAGSGERRPPEATGDWWGRVTQDLANAEYEISWQERTVLADLREAWQAPNRAHGLRTYFVPAGIRVVARGEETPSWEWGLTWVRYGRPSASVLLTPEEADLVPVGNRIEYVRGPLTEWYVNDPRGLEQGFHLAVPPERVGTVSAGTGVESPGPIAIDLSIRGALAPIVSPDGQVVEFVSSGGVLLIRYDTLTVFDAEGQSLPAHLEGFNDAGVRGIRIVIDDTGASYPLTVDPIITTSSWIVEGTAVGDLVGSSASTAGDVNGDGYNDVIVGAPLADPGLANAGRVYVYHGSPSGLGATPAWVADGTLVGEAFGGSVATAGDVNRDGFSDVVIGARLHDTIHDEAGAAFVYHGSLSGLSTTADWIATGDQVMGRFGHAVSAAGDVDGDGFGDVIVGVPDRDDGELADAGAAYVYHGSVSGLSSSPDWSRFGGQAGDQFGFSVGSAGDVNGDGFADVVIGEPGFDWVGNDQGRATVYNGSASGLSPAPDWADYGNNQHFQFYGSSVSTVGDMDGDGYSDVAVGAPGYQDFPTGSGAVYVYNGHGSGLIEESSLLIEGTQPGSGFGAVVGLAGDVDGDGYSDMIFGHEGYDAPALTDSGRFFLYYGSENGFDLADFDKVEGDQSGGLLGNAVFTAGDVNGDGLSDVIVGEKGYDGIPGADSGRVRVYHGSLRGLALTAGWEDGGGQSNGWFGFSVASAGDVNGDGHADVIVGAPNYDSGQADEGLAFVYFGATFGLSPGPLASFQGNEVSAHFGHSVAGAGDVNGDGYDDVVVGAPDSDFNTPGSGAAYVFHGAPSGFAPGTAWSTGGGASNAQHGFSVASAGDVNGDGYADVIVGAPRYATGFRGAAFLYLGSPTGLSADLDWFTATTQDSSQLGYSVGTAGDVNGDGFSDVIVGAFEWDGDQINEGKAFVYHGSETIPSLDADWSMEGNQQPAFFGVSVGTAGDVNGDGYSDVIVGCRDCGAVQGAAYVFHGSANGLSLAANWSEFGTPGSSFGNSVGTAGDVNSDGFADVIVGARKQDVTITDEGAAYVYYGSAAGLPGSPSWTLLGDQSAEFTGYSVAGAGDVNGDGFADVVVGSPFYHGGGSDTGRARLFFGNRGVPLVPRQRRMDDTGPIADMGLADTTDGFRLKLIGRTPFGRGFLQLEREVKPVGVSFDAANLEYGALTDTFGTGVGLSQVVDGLAEAPVYHWRVRFAYDPVTVPWQSRSRWFTVPWNGWEEADVRLPCSDADGDGYGTLGNPSCFSGSQADCDDTDPAVFPGAPDLCDGLATDCNQFGWPEVSFLESDPDGDGYVFCDPWVGRGSILGGGDCAEGLPHIYPGAPELCDGSANDCLTPGWPQLPADETDSDGDGFVACDPWTGGGAVVGGGDCAAADPDIYPGAPEINDGQDNQCEGDPGFGVADEISGVSGFSNPASKHEYAWPPQPGASMYEAGRSDLPNFSAGCIGIETPGTAWLDVSVPASGAVYHYLSRPVAPHLGSWGQDSSGGERTSVCP